MSPLSRFVIDYCQLGFIGKLFKSTDLPTLIQFFLMFYNDKPVDWLLENVIQTMVCKLDQDLKTCKKEKSLLWVHFKPSLFQVRIHQSAVINIGPMAANALNLIQLARGSFFHLAEP